MQFIRRLCSTTLLFMSMLFAVPSEAQRCDSCDACVPRIALKTNLLYDAAITPNIGAEISLARKWSLSINGLWAWWSKDSKHFYWRIYGGDVEARWWFGHKSRTRSLTGHHAGIYGSLHSFDFEFGHTGYQSPEITYGVGVSYGYSIRLADRLNLDFSIKGGYSRGKLIKYHPECGTYVCDKKVFHEILGITGAEITLVWFPGNKGKNHPDYE